MKVLHFYKTAVPDTYGGIEQCMHQIASGSARHGIESHVLSLSTDGPATHAMPGYTRHTARLDFQISSTGFSRSALHRFRELARQADIVHYQFPWPFMDMVHFASGLRRPSVLTYQSDIVRQKHLLKLYRPLMHRFLGQMDRIVATSPDYLASSTVLQRYRDKVHVIPIGLDAATYPDVSAERKWHWQSQLGSAPFFLFLGVMRYYKGLHVLVEALRGTGMRAVLVGSGPMESAIRAQARCLAPGQIIFTGSLPHEDKVALLDLCHAMVFPSHLRSEAFGISLLEASMFGKAIISCDIGTGTSYVNQHGVTGLVTPPSHPAALRQAMHTLWHDSALAARMGVQARVRYQELFTGARMTAAYADLYRSTLKARRTGDGQVSPTQNGNTQAFAATP
ncbi:MAG: glycosyltransferase [Pseudomonadota bacterium]|nr:glycosyltransferase [Pseudomonadota bacterium]